MRYYVEDSLRNFPAWSGGRDTLKKLIELDRVEEVEEYVKECLPDASDITINDFLWFEIDFIFMELLGMTEEEYKNL